jgi:hypothetical protein
MSWSQAAFPSRRSSVRNTWFLPNPLQRRRHCYWRCTRRRAQFLWLCSHWGAIYKQATTALLVLGALAGTMQLLDAGIGLFEHDLRKCAGPLFIAVLQFLVVYLLHRSVRITSQTKRG